MNSEIRLNQLDQVQVSGYVIQILDANNFTNGTGNSGCYCTGLLTGVFYPLNNPSGFITGATGYLPLSQTGNILFIGDPRLITTILSTINPSNFALLTGNITNTTNYFNINNIFADGNYIKIGQNSNSFEAPPALTVEGTTQLNGILNTAGSGVNLDNGNIFSDGSGDFYCSTLQVGGGDEFLNFTPLTVIVGRGSQSNLVEFTDLVGNILGYIDNNCNISGNLVSGVTVFSNGSQVATLDASNNFTNANNNFAGNVNVSGLIQFTDNFNNLICFNQIQDPSGVPLLSYFRERLGTPPFFTGGLINIRTLNDEFGNNAVGFATGNKFLYDNNTIKSCDYNKRFLFHTGGSGTLDWQNKYLYDSNFLVSEDWGNRYLYYNNGIISIDWGNGLSNDNSMLKSVDWFNRYLWDVNGNNVIQWNNNLIYDSSINQVISIDWSGRKLYNGALGGGIETLDWNNKILTGNWNATNINISGSNLALASQTGKFATTTGPNTFSNTNTFLSGLKISGNLTFASAGNFINDIIDAKGNPIFISNYSGPIRGFFDNTGQLAISFSTSSRILAVNNGVASLDWGNKVLYDNSNISAGTWQNRTLNDFNGTPVILWNIFSLTDGSGVDSLQWDSRNLYDNAGTRTLDWQNKLLTGGQWNTQGLTVSGSPIAVLNSVNTFTNINNFNSGVNISGNLQFINTGNFYSNYILDQTGKAILQCGISSPSHRPIRILWDDQNTIAVSFSSSARQLSDNSNGLSIDWNNRIADDNTTTHSIDWQNRILFDAFQNPIINWSAYNLSDGTGINALQWDSRTLYDINGNESLDWTNRILTGGSWIANGLLISGSSVITSSQTGNLTNQFYPLNSNPAGYVTSSSGGATIKITGSNPIITGNFSGIGGTSVILSGSFILISGSIGSGILPTNVVYTTGNQTGLNGITGFKTFYNGIIISGGGGENLYLQQKNNTEIVFGLNVNSLNGDAIDNSLDSSFKLGLMTNNQNNGGGGYNGFHFQTNTGGSWSNHITAWTVDVSGNMVVTGNQYTLKNITTYGNFISGNTNISNLFYPLNSNPSGFITNIQTGILTGNFYPLNSGVTLNDTLIDLSAINSVDWQNRFLYDNGALVSLDYQNRLLYTSTSQSINYGNRNLIDSSNDSSIDWQNRLLKRSPANRNTNSLDYDNLLLTGGTWQAQSLSVGGITLSGSQGYGGGTYSFQKQISPSGTGNFFSIQNNNGAQVFQCFANCSSSGFSVAKIIQVVKQLNANPITQLSLNTGPYSGNDFTVNFAATGNSGIFASVINNGTLTGIFDLTLTLGASSQFTQILTY